MEFKWRHVQCLGPGGLHRMAYTEWGDPANPRVLVCVHGLTRNARDFDFLAAALADQYRVVCVDIVGRGQSDWLSDPSGYTVQHYVADMVTLLARLDVPQVDWVGTSMGGLIGMALASMADSPIRRLVLNDIGPEITVEAIERIVSYVGLDPRWANFDEAMAYVRLVSAPFGNLSEAQWQHLTEHAVRRYDDGSWGFRYDPAIAAPFKTAFTGEPIDLWPLYERIACPVLALRGEHSDLLLKDAFLKMGERGPRAKLLEIPGVGHAPMFLEAGQVAPVREFLLAP